MNNSKIKTIEELASELKKARLAKKKIVLCQGYFYLLHIGHIRYFEQARAMGDILIVTVTPDRFVENDPHGSVLSELMRVEAVASLSCVDFVAVNEWPTTSETLRILKPDLYVKGSEFKDITFDPKGEIGIEHQVLQEIGAKMAFTDDVNFSSTNIINRYLAKFPEEIQQYLQLVQERHNLDDVLAILDSMSSLKVCVIGDNIIDDYHYCEAIGKSSKEPTLALQYQSSDKFAGGIVAIANHVANFAGAVQLATVLGEIDSHEKFIIERLHEKVSPFFVTHPGAPTLIKRRFVEGYSLNKLLEVYIMGDNRLPSQPDNEACEWLKNNLKNFDLVIVADYGHGAISANMIDILVNEAPFLAVNTQANAGNRGFHTISRYPRADYVCLAEPELRLEMKSETGDLHPMLVTVLKRMQCKKLVVTRGKKGCFIKDADGSFYEAPAFAYKVIDRIGAGDAFFSITSLAAFLNISNELLGFIGNAVGSIAVEIIGNERSVSSALLQKNIRSLFNVS